MDKVHKSLILVAMTATIFGVVGCQTTGSISNVTTPNAVRAKKIISRTCVTQTTTDGYTKPKNKRQFDDDETTIRFVSRGVDNWWRFGARVNKVYDEVYINTRTQAVACGYENWKNYKIKYQKIKVPFSNSLFVEEIDRFKKNGGSKVSTQETSNI